MAISHSSRTSPAALGVTASSLEVDGTTLVVDHANDRVGIGVAAPTYTLEVAGNVGFDEYLYHNDDTDTYLRLLGDTFDIVCGNTKLISYYESGNDAVHVNPQNGDVNFIVDSDNEDDSLFIEGSSGKVGLGVGAPVTRLTVEGTITLKEQADADADTAAYGQIWVNTATPCELWFTDDAGTDTQLGTGGGGAADDSNTILHMSVFA